MDNEFEKEYRKLDIEAGKYNRPEFDEVYKFIEQGLSEEEALNKAGYSDDENFVCDFYKYREIDLKALELQKKALERALKYVHQNIPLDEAMQKVGFKKSVTLQNIIDKIASTAKKENPYFPHPKPFEHLKAENADLECFLMLEKAHFSHSGLTLFYKALKEYEVIDLIDKLGGIALLFQALKNLCTFIIENNHKPITIQNKMTEVLKEFDSYVGVGLIWQILILRGVSVFLGGIKLKKRDKGFSEMQVIYEWISKRLVYSLVFFYRYNWGEEDYKLIAPLREYINSTEIGQAVKRKIEGERNETETTGSNIKIIEADREDLFSIIKGYIKVTQHKQLFELLGGLDISSKIIFKGNANQLADIFKKLYECNMTTATTKKSLAEWLVKNFSVETANKIKNLKLETTERSLTNKYYECKNPIIDVKGGKIEKTYRK